MIFNSLKHNGPAREYPTKSIIIVHPKNLEAGGYLYNVMGLRYAWAKVIRGKRYEKVIHGDG